MGKIIERDLGLTLTTGQTLPAIRQAIQSNEGYILIHELLSEGRANARTGGELAQHFHCGVREITAQIEKERREGLPICAATGENPGYYLAEDADELQSYCERLQARAIELIKTRQALIDTLRRIQGRKEALARGKREEGDG